MIGGFPGTFGKLQNFGLVEPAGKRAKEGDSPVNEKPKSSLFRYLSSAGHEKSCVN